MIKVAINRSRAGKITSVQLNGHGDASKVCPAVSLLVLNTANSIEALTDEAFTCDYNEDGGFIHIQVKNPGSEASLLLEACVLGLYSVQETYNDDISIVEVKDGKHD